jgi:hypothetical protein
MAFKEHKETLMVIQRVTLLTWGDPKITRLAAAGWCYWEYRAFLSGPENTGKTLWTTR